VGGAGSGGGAPDGGIPTAIGPSRGSPIALTPKDEYAVVVNRDVGSVSILALSYAMPDAPSATKVAELSTGAGSEPWQVETSPNSNNAFVALRHDQKLVRIDDISPIAKIGPSAQVGSEPTGVALTPTGSKAYVTNWVDGTISVVDTASMKVAQTIDLNAALVGTGLLGSVAARPGLAHPRSIAISNDGNADDADETAYVTDYFAQRKIPEAADGTNADVAQVGIVYRVSLKTGLVAVTQLSPLANIGFKDQNGNVAGCYPNQLQSITLNGKFAYVLSICASPRGPVGPNVTTTPCTDVTQCTGLVEPACVVPAAGVASVCVDLASAKTTTAPVVSVIDTTTGVEVMDAEASLNAVWTTDVYVKAGTPGDASRRLPHMPTDLAFVPGTSVSYVTANGADAVFRVVFDDAKGSIGSV